jgi:exodeoxyribonuclease V alpha subunit
MIRSLPVTYSGSAKFNQPLVSLTGVVERITYYAEETGYTIARLHAPKHYDLVTITGNFAQIQAGQTLRLEGTWKEHPQYGQQFLVVRYTETKPATLTGIEKYLGSGLIKGVGPATAKKIVAYFNLETLEIIEQQSDRLIEVPGIGKKRVRMIQTAWAAQLAIKEVMLFLQGHGVSTTYAVKIFKQYGDKAIATVTHNPYQLAEDIFGIGFLTADTIARKLGIAPDSPFRYRAGITHVLTEAAEDGHCFLPQPELLEGAIAKLTTEDYPATTESVLEVLYDMGQKQDVIAEKVGEMPLHYQPSFFHTEQNLANLTLKLLEQRRATDLPRVRNWIDRFTASRKIELSVEQQRAVEMAASESVMILTGGPGCGKTFCTRTIVAMWKAMGKNIALAAPTGRAAQRLSEMAGIEAKTLHRLLEFDPGNHGFKRNAENPLPQDAIVIDEASMLDLFLAHALFKAIRPDAQVLLVGDIDQLPAVGPGNVLADLMSCDRLPVVTLTEVFRQAQSSGIIRAAHQINRGQFPILEPISGQPRSDCLWHGGGQEPEHGVQTIRELLVDFIPRLGFNPVTEVQVLCPMTRGTIGTRNLNTVLQELLNPPASGKPEISRGGAILRVGDRVMQLKNDYEREVFNGDLGVVGAIDPTEQEVAILFDGRRVVYDYGDLNELGLAWAISIHKSQGSEYPVVILPLYMQHYLLLSRNLLYTGLTRAKKLAIIVGSSKAIGLAVKQNQSGKRYTRLPDRIQGASDYRER